MVIFIIHPYFPGQFKHLVPYLASNKENQVYFLANYNEADTKLENVKLVLYNSYSDKQKQWIDSTNILVNAAEATLYGQATIKAMIYLRDRKNIIPDIIIGHTGWGSLLYCKDIYPNVPVIGYFEWYYHALKSDGWWWEDEVPTTYQKIAVRTKNMHHLLSLESCDVGICPTKWQFNQFPTEYHSKLNIIHEGINTQFFIPNKQPLVLNDLQLPNDIELVTYATRGLEIYRGFPYFMDAIRILLKKRPKLHIVIAGKDKVYYGLKLPDKTFLQAEKEKGQFDTERVHFVGFRNKLDYLKILQASDCHVYLTRPFILSWSLLEAMSCEVPIVSSSVPPVQEVIKDNINGLLADFRSPEDIANKIEILLDNKEKARLLGQQARQTILQRYNLMDCLHTYDNLINKVVKQSKTPRLKV